MALHEQICGRCETMTTDHLAVCCDECGSHDMSFLDVCDWCGEAFEPGQEKMAVYFIVAMKWVLDIPGAFAGVMIRRGTDHYHEECYHEERDSRR